MTADDAVTFTRLKVGWWRARGHPESLPFFIVSDNGKEIVYWWHAPSFNRWCIECWTLLHSSSQRDDFVPASMDKVNDLLLCHGAPPVSGPIDTSMIIGQVPPCG